MSTEPAPRRACSAAAQRRVGQQSLRPPETRQQLGRCQACGLLSVVEHCAEPREDALGRAVLNDVPERGRDANGDQLRQRRRPRERNVGCYSAELL